MRENRRRTLVAWLARQRMPQYLQVLLGVYLVAVPTVYSVVPRWAGTTKLSIRPVVLGLWGAAAVLVVTATALQDEHVRSLLIGKAQMQHRLAVKARADVLSALVACGRGSIPNHYEFTVYVYNQDRKRLEPVYPPLNPPLAPDPREFEAGKGASGLAWERWKRHPVTFVRGDDVSSDKYQLTPLQQEFFAKYRSVASAVAWDLDGQPLGVVTALSQRDDDSFERSERRDDLASLAETIGVVLAAIPEPDDES